jgi:hypothetical protein
MFVCLFYTNCPFESYPVHVTSEFGMNNFVSLTGMFLLRSTLKHDRGQNYVDIYLFISN